MRENGALNGGTDVKIGLIGIVKNEGPYLIDWIGWHRALGIGPIAIGDNVSTDGSSELLEALHDLGEIRRVSTPEAFRSVSQAHALTGC